MNKVPVIRKEKIVSYLTPSLLWGTILGVVSFLIALIDVYAVDALWTGLGVCLSVTVLYTAVGLFYEEYYKRRQIIKRLNSDRYSFLREQQFSIHSELIFIGTYKDYLIWVTPKYEDEGVKFGDKLDVITAFYYIDSEHREKKEEQLTGRGFPGRLFFYCAQVCCMPTDLDNPNFQEDLDRLVDILKQENLAPISYEAWEKLYLPSFPKGEPISDR